MFENETTEFKKSTSELDEAMKSISAILNKHSSGKLYFGIKDDGTPVKTNINTSTTRDISRKIYECIKPQIFPIIDIVNIDGIDVIEVVFEGKDTPYSSKGRYYIRTGDEDRELTPSELKKMMIQNEYKENFEDHLTSETINDIDNETLNSFYKSAISCGRMPNENLSIEQLLDKLNLIRNHRLTNAGKLLFSKNKPLVLKCAMFATDQKVTFIDIQRYEGNIFQLISKGMQYIIEHINWRVEFSETSTQRIEIPEVPIKALREAVINSFAHARYDIKVQHEIDIFSNRISIINPGNFANEYTPLDYASKNLKSYLRNETIAKVLFLCQDVETFGHGLKKIYDLCNESNVSLNYINEDTNFTFEFSRVDRNKVPNGTTNGTTNGTINDEEKKILNFFRNEPNITIIEISIKTNKSIRNLKRIISSLKDKQLLERVGSNKGGYWKVIDK